MTLQDHYGNRLSTRSADAVAAYDRAVHLFLGAQHGAVAGFAEALAGDGERLARIAEDANGFAGDLVRPLARGWWAMARGDWAEALAALTPVMAATERLGGSRAQRRGAAQPGHPPPGPCRVPAGGRSGLAAQSARSVNRLSLSRKSSLSCSIVPWLMSRNSTRPSP
ncbi:MAG: hypothetical protein ACK5MY_06995 [Jhaorihella sp.]